MAIIKAVVRIESDGCALLVFHGTDHMRRAESFSRKDGHGMLCQRYYNNSTTAPRDADDKAQAERIVSSYSAICAAYGDTLQIVSRMNWS